MSETEKLVVINFGSPMSDDLKNQISAVIGREIEEKHYLVGIYMKKNIYIQCVDIIDRIDLKNLPTDYVVNLPGLPIASVYLINELEARTGAKPNILELHREKDERGVLSDFKYGKIVNLDVETQYTQKKQAKKT